MFEAGELVLLPFPFTDASASKRRPVLMLTTPDEYGDFIGMAISSRSHHANAEPLQNDSLSEGYLPKPSWIRVDRVVTLNVGLVTKSFAKTKSEVRRQAVSRLCEMLQRQISTV
ncbi:MAG: type II toxin-antitoxin system PemK/MazF family toxin [Nitrosomonadales bacterium]|nr:type II toxin-antitoxin system PemK/MazF family toxin [Nitrosomonadales bacterium]